MAAPEIERLIRLLARLPGLGPRSARRAALTLLERREQLLEPLAAALTETADRVTVCGRCGNLDSSDPCGVCLDVKRDPSILCVVEDVADLWALDRSGAFAGRYHVLGGTLSALDGRGPEQLRIAPLVARASEPEVKEVILALGATVEGQTTAHYIADRLTAAEVTVTYLA
ncbi:MAG: recombination mediator RecR, partial [Limibacillus sp.]